MRCTEHCRSKHFSDKRNEEIGVFLQILNSEFKNLSDAKILKILINSIGKSV
jgi:hypothetical protein